MSALTEPVAKRIATLFRLLFSDQEGEAMAALAALKRVFKNEELSPHDVGTMIENANGEIETLKYSDEDAKQIFEHGIEQGRKQHTGRALSEEFFDDAGDVRWPEMVRFCEAHSGKIGLRPAEQNFVHEQVIKAQSSWPRSPSQNTVAFMLQIFYKLRGSLR